MNTPIKLALIALTLVTARAMAGDDIKLSDADRMRHVAMGRIWSAVNVGAQDTLVGPPLPKDFDPSQVIRCTFKDWTKEEFNDPDRGMNQKFRCVDNVTKKKLKIRYGADNHENYSQIVAHRLAWALGFQAQKAYRVKVICDNCPADPYREDPSKKPTPRATRAFDYATAQFSIGNQMGMDEDQGWDWKELDNVSTAVGGAPRYEVDALRLFATFIYHVDSQQAQQKMICHDQDVLGAAPGKPGTGCRMPWLMIGDAGGTFGGRVKGEYQATNLATWATMPFWKDGKSKNCKLGLDDLEGEFKKVKVTKQGADFFANLLRRLSQTQIRNLFVAAGMDDYAPHMDAKAKLPDGTRINYTIDDWVAAFNARAAQAINHECQD